MDTNEHGRDVSRWKDGEVPAAEATRIEAHLAECPECRKAADVIDAVRRHIGEWTAPEAPGDLSNRVWANRVLARVHARAANILSMKTHLRLTAVAAGVLLVASLAFVPFLNGKPEPDRSLTDVALEEMMTELAADNLPAISAEEEDR